jgi:hypothetical protein
MLFIKKILKNLYESHRIGVTTSKTLLWLYVKKDLPKIRGKLGVDLAGGNMGTKRFFSTKKYISVDINQNKLDEGKKNNPDAVAINSKIQDYMKNYQEEKPELLVCLQTFGINTIFQNEETLDVVKMMYNFLKPGGSMIFNAGEFSLNLNKFEQELTPYLKSKFKKVDRKFYGAWILYNKSISGPYKLIFAYIMYIFPFLTKIFSIKQKYVYFCCKNKI